MKNLYVWILGLALTAGCSTTTRTRYEVGSSSQAVGRVSAEDRQAVKEALAVVATELRLKDFTQSSLVPETVAYYQQADTRNPLKLIAWVDNNCINVDLMQAPTEPGESRLYRRAEELLRKELAQRFGERSATVNFRQLNRTPTEEK